MRYIDTVGEGIKWWLYILASALLAADGCAIHGANARHSVDAPTHAQAHVNGCMIACTHAQPSCRQWFNIMPNMTMPTTSTIILPKFDTLQNRNASRTNMAYIYMCFWLTLTSICRLPLNCHGNPRYSTSTRRRRRTRSRLSRWVKWSRSAAHWPG